MFEFLIIVYAKSRSSIPGYQHIRKEAVEVGLITINPHTVGLIEIVPALYVPSSKRVYIKEEAFNKHWKVKAQEYFEENLGTHQDFMDIFRRNYK